MTAAAGLVILSAALDRNFSWPLDRHLLVALGITAAFALIGRLTHGVDFSGALAGFAVALVLAARDLRMFWVLLVVFAVTLIATRTGGDRKRQLRDGEYAGESGNENGGPARAESGSGNRAAEINGAFTKIKSENAALGANVSPAVFNRKPDDRRGRSASQVMANLGVAGLMVALAPKLWPVLALAALAEAAADTCSSEIGMAFPGKTVLITTWKPVAPGIDGGVTLLGTMAALIAASVVAFPAWVLGLATIHFMVVVIAAGFVGSLVDSLLGALLERRGWLNNDAVNLLGTATATAIAWAIA